MKISVENNKILIKLLLRLDQSSAVGASYENDENGQLNPDLEEQGSDDADLASTEPEQ
jgi:hypothetical protein